MTETAPAVLQVEPQASVSLSPGVQQQMSTNPETFNTSGEINTTPETKAELDENAWQYAEGIAGEGEAPDWFNKKSYKTIADQAKAHTELRKLLGGFTGAPDAYELNLGEEYKDFKIDSDNPAIKKFSEMAKNGNMSQDFFSKALEVYADLQNQEAVSLKEFNEKEFAKIGPNPQEKLDEINTWYKQNHLKDSGLTEKEFEGVFTSYNAYKAFAAIRAQKGQTLPSSSEAMASNKTREDFVKMMGDNRYGRDMVYTKQVDDDFAKCADHIEIR